MENNTTVADGIEAEGQPWYVMVSSFFMCLVAVITITGNVFVIASVFTYRPLRTVPNFFIVSLASADTLVALVVMPFHISTNIVGYWIYGGLLCKIWLTFDVLLCTSSILNLCVIALDRYWAIHDPLNYQQKRTVKRVLVMILMAWVISALVSIPPLFGWGQSDTDPLYHPVAKSCTLSSDEGYVLYSACGSFYIPLAVMSFVYLKIYLATQKRLRQRTKAAAATKLAMLNSANNSAPATKERNNSDSAEGDEPETSIREHEQARQENGNDKKIQRTVSKKESLDVENDDAETSLHEPDKGRKENGNDKKKQRKASKKELQNAARNGRTTMQNFFEEKQRISLSKERKAARTLAIVMITFVLCWIPFFLMYLILPFCSTCTNPGKAVEMLFVWLGYLNSTLNPIIYTIFNTEFRKAFNDMVSKCSGTQQRGGRMPRTYV